MGAAWELASFVVRTLGTKHQQNATFVTISVLLFLLAPLCESSRHCRTRSQMDSSFPIGINAFDYMVLGRMVHYYIPEKRLFHVKATRFSVYFVWLDIISFLVQVSGGIILSGTNQPAHLLAIGKDIYMSGIGMQQLFILFFVGMVISFHRRMVELEADGRLYGTGKEKWRGLVYALYISLLLISVSPLHPPNNATQFLTRALRFVSYTGLLNSLAVRNPIIQFPITKSTCTSSMHFQWP